jgi:hypothetical protein
MEVEQFNCLAQLLQGSCDLWVQGHQEVLREGWLSPSQHIVRGNNTDLLLDPDIDILSLLCDTPHHLHLINNHYYVCRMLEGISFRQSLIQTRSALRVRVVHFLDSARRLF